MSQFKQSKRSIYRYPTIVGVVLILLGGLFWLSTRSSQEKAPAETEAFAETTVEEASPIDSASEAPSPDGDPLLLGVSIHVEGWEEENKNKDLFLVHRRAVHQMAVEASEAQAVLTFELSESFMRATQTWDDDIIDVLIELGQGVAVHADVGGRGNPTLGQLVRPLEEMRLLLSDLGVETTHVSGICSRGPWIEAALAAGYTSTTGAVEYCLTSLDEENLPEGHQEIASCANPAQCHGEPPVSEDQRIHPFLVNDSSDFLSDAEPADGDEALLLIVGEAGHSLSCLAEQVGGGSGCVAASDDLVHVTNDIEEYLAAMTTSVHTEAQVAVLTWSWSVGSAPYAGFTTEVTEVIAPYVDSGEVQWMSIADLAAAARP